MLDPNDPTTPVRPVEAAGDLVADEPPGLAEARTRIAEVAAQTSRLGAAPTPTPAPPPELHPFDPWAVLWAMLMVAAVVVGVGVHARHQPELHWLWPAGLGVVGVAFLASLSRHFRPTPPGPR